MILEFIKAGQKHIALAMFGFSAVLAVVMVSRVAACKVGQTKIPAAIKSAAEKGTLDDEAVKKYLVNFTKCANKLKKKNMFTSPPSKPKPPTCSGIIGDRAIISGKSYKVGEKVAGAEIVSIGTKNITILWEGAEKTLDAFGSSKSGSSDAKPSKKSKQKKPPVPVQDDAPAPVSVAPQMPSGDIEMSNEERMERRQRLMESRRQMGGGRGRRGRGSDGERRGSRSVSRRSEQDR